MERAHFESALQRAVKKAKQLPNAEKFKHEPNMCYGFDSARLRILSYQYAKKLKFIISLTWEKEKKATKDWLKNFKQRYKAVLSLRKPEKTTTAFNPTTLNNFFDNLEMSLHKITQKNNKNKSIHSDEAGPSTSGLASTPEAIRPFPKAPKRKLTTKRKKKSTKRKLSKKA
ncbi:hypothetical protein ILUMI_17287 [Ignelater luminosus]|uniref:Uncharacterized protein n=1 Tax=Ignelater luminosus TaxID=2038154 RepID=A0A8K0G7P4_IGNLU|nr:hypothetical protein ILUMI_17287 [Ignelater luminosus]